MTASAAQAATSRAFSGLPLPASGIVLGKDATEAVDTKAFSSHPEQRGEGSAGEESLTAHGRRRRTQLAHMTRRILAPRDSAKSVGGTSGRRGWTAVKLLRMIQGDTWALLGLSCIVLAIWLKSNSTEAKEPSVNEIPPGGGQGLPSDADKANGVSTRLRRLRELLIGFALASLGPLLLHAMPSNSTTPTPGTSSEPNAITTTPTPGSSAVTPELVFVVLSFTLLAFLVVAVVIAIQKCRKIHKQVARFEREIELRAARAAWERFEREIPNV